MPGGCWRDFATYDDGENDVCSRLGYERLKAENASLLGSLRETKKFYQDHDDMLARQLAAAEQRAEAAEKDLGKQHSLTALRETQLAAAEKRSADLTGALREIAKPRPRWRTFDQYAGEFQELQDIARAALHDEERSEGDNGK